MKIQGECAAGIAGILLFSPTSRPERSWPSAGSFLRGEGKFSPKTHIPQKDCRGRASSRPTSNLTQSAKDARKAKATPAAGNLPRAAQQGMLGSLSGHPPSRRTTIVNDEMKKAAGMWACTGQTTYRPLAMSVALRRLFPDELHRLDGLAILGHPQHIHARGGERETHRLACAKRS